jgi:hypothetical protein
MLRAGVGRNGTHAVLTKLAGTPLLPCANLAKGAVEDKAILDKKYLKDREKQMKQVNKFMGKLNSAEF